MPEIPTQPAYKGTHPFMHCTHCDRYSGVWNVRNEAFVCPCGMDESGLELFNPTDLIGMFFKGRAGIVRVIDYLGGNTVRVIDRNDITYTSSILAMKVA